MGSFFFAFGIVFDYVLFCFVSTEQAFYRCDRKGREEDRDRENSKRKLKINNLEKQEHNNRFVNKCWIYSFVYFSVCLE